MPPKVKTESTELQVFNLEKFSIAQLPEFQAKKDEIGAVISLNPIVEIIDNSTYELAKKSRTAVKTLRTGLEKEQADVKRKIKANILDVVDKEYDQLVLDVKKQESDRQTPITTYEAEAELKRQEKARIEQQRIDGVKKEIEDYTSQWKTAINLMTFDSIAKVSAEFLESYTSFDTTILQEFEALFPVKIEELSQLLSDRTVSLTNTENARLEIIRLEEEAEALRFEKARLEALARIAEAAEAKAKKEREAFEKEKAEFAEKQKIAAQKEFIEAMRSVNENRVNITYDLPKTPPTEKQAIAAKKETFENRKNILLDLGFQFDDNIWEERDFGTTLDDVNNMNEERFEEFLDYAKDVAIAIKTPPTEKVEIPEILVPEIPTVNVCTSENEVDKSAIQLAKEYCQKEIIANTPTWDDIEKDFKSSGEKSYSKWLKSNYNVPIKL